MQRQQILNNTTMNSSFLSSGSGILNPMDAANTSMGMIAGYQSNREV